MGLGDHIMALGELEQAKHGDPNGEFGFADMNRGEFVFPLGCRSLEFSQLTRQRREKERIEREVKPSGRFLTFDSNTKDRVHWLGHVSGRRPYIKKTHHDHFEFRRQVWPMAGTLRVTKRERKSVPSSDVVLGDTVKGTVSGSNKQWGVRNWNELNRAILESGYKTTVFHGSKVALPSTVLPELDIWRAIAAIESARLVITNEGFLHHVAEAVGTPCVVIAGGYTAQDVTGYACQLWFQDDVACGSRQDCAHCRKAMGRIKPGDVWERTKEFIGWNG